jgi:hypothetical protein
MRNYARERQRKWPGSNERANALPREADEETHVLDRVDSGGVDPTAATQENSAAG